MDWDIKASSGQWDWENMLFPLRASDIGKRAQWSNDVGDCAAPTEADNGSVYSPGSAAAGGSAGAFGYMSSRSSVTVDCPAKADTDLSRIKVEPLEASVLDARNVTFLDLRSQALNKEESDKGKRPEGVGNGMSKDVYKSHVAAMKESDRKGKECGSKEDCGNTVNDAVLNSAGDAHLGLKLGKRTYFEDTTATAGGGGGGGGSSIKTPPIAIFPASSSSSSASKKHRGPSQANQTPRCQVEGCHKELTACKEYHRRHKVCEVHSKSAKVTVAGIEQRFCQQCSRFHVLSEFDDGKRSCRRRLAGHNERRRKPQPDNMALSSMRLATSSFDSRRNGLLIDRSALLHPRIYSSTVLDDHCNFKLGQSKLLWPRLVKSEDPYMLDSSYLPTGASRQFHGNAYTRPTADRLLQLLQTSRVASGDPLNQNIQHYPYCQTSHFTQSSAISASSGTGFPDLEVASVTNGLSGVSDSGRALSLLSSQSWGLRAPVSSSLDLSSRIGVAAMESQQYPQGNSHLSVGNISQLQGIHHNFSLVPDKLLGSTSESSTGLVSAEYSPHGLNFMDKISNGSSLPNNILGMENFETPMHGFLNADEFKNSQELKQKDVRRTIDLMHRTSQAGESQDQSGIAQSTHGQFMEFQLMRNYGSSVFESRHI